MLQILEGDRKLVSETYNQIIQDPRHHEIVLLDCSAIEQRTFAEWSMGYVGETATNRTIFLHYTGSDKFQPYDLTSENAHRLMTTLAGELREKKFLAVA